MKKKYYIQEIKINKNLSSKGRIWQLKSICQKESLVANVAHVLEQPKTVIKLLYQLGFVDVEMMRQYLQMNVSQAAAQILRIPNLNHCIQRFKQAILNRDKIQVISDYDVDGISAATLLARYLKMWQCSVKVYIPHRFHEGYGPTQKIVNDINQQDIDLVIVLDSGSNAQCLDDLKCDVIVIDHHIIHTALKKVILINGQLANESESQLLHCDHLCTTGLLFLLLWHLKQDKQLCQQSQAALINKKMDQLNILISLSTICDAVPLTAINRAIVRSVLTNLHTDAPVMISMKLLLEFLGKNITRCSVQDLAFNVGPVVNAASRMTGRADLALQLFMEDDCVNIQKLIQILYNLNQERKHIEMHTLQEAKLQIKQKYVTKLPNCLVLYQASWHLGVVGIVAGRLAQEFNRPVLILAQNAERWQGSGRSITDVDLNDCLQRIKQYCPTLTGGGHKMAIGLSLSDDDLQSLQLHFNDVIAKHYNVNQESSSIVYFNDQFENISGLDSAFVKKINILSPFGMNNPMPVFLLSGLRLSKRLVFSQVSRFYFRDRYGHTLAAILFHRRNIELDNMLIDQGIYDLLVHLSINYYQEKEQVQIVIEDARQHE